MRPSGIEGRIAVVSGAAGGIGSAIVRGLHEEGAIVVAMDCDASRVSSLAMQLSTPQAHVRAEVVDVRSPEQVAAAVERVERECGPVDFGVNVAGVLRIANVVDTDIQDWRDTLDINAGGVFNLSQALARHMIPRRRGNIVTVSSNAAGVPRQRMAAYAASKAAATMLTRCLGLELARYGIRCNVVAPGSTRTPMQESLWSDGSGAETAICGSLETFRNGIPLQKLAEPEDVAEAVLFLLSDRASHITMTDLYVDGGATLRA